MQNKLWFGAAYYPEYLPHRPIEEDMRLMREAGFNLIRVAESTWSTWEPRDGVSDFSILRETLERARTSLSPTILTTSGATSLLRPPAGGGPIPGRPGGDGGGLRHLPQERGPAPYYRMLMMN